jgi:transposase
MWIHQVRRITYVSAMTTNAGHTHRNKAELQQLLSVRDAEIARQSAELLARDLLIEKLKLQLANLRRQRFGAKSEALDKIIDQLELALVEAEAAAEQHDCEPLSVEADAKGQPTRKPLPEHLPREDVVLHPGETCEQCGGALRHLGEDVSETLEYVPGRIKVTRTVRPKLSCRCCETIHQVAAPAMPIERGRPGPGLLAHVLVSKYADHLPLYRQSQIYGREGMPLERSTLADWSDNRQHFSHLSQKPLVVTSWRVLPSTPMIRRSRCWRRDPAKPRPAGCGSI